MLRKQFSNFLEEEQLLSPSGPVLLAVSGGVDSMVMADLFRRDGIPFGIAHCNYQLRGRDSDLDAALVQQQAQDWNVPFFQVRFKTEAEARKQQKSIQLIARELRYEWLEKVRTAHGFATIATAHHLNDQLETLLLNLTNGCGIRGLHGIHPKRDRLIRPLLFATRGAIEQYAEAQHIPFREDASNAATYYDRNKIRLQVVPVLKSINPAFEAGFLKTLTRLQEAEALYVYAVENLLASMSEPTEQGARLKIRSLLEAPAPASVLYEWLRPFNFNNSQVAMILEAISREPGKLFYSDTHRLLLDREFLFVERLPGSEEAYIRIAAGQEEVQLPDGQLRLSSLSAPPHRFPADPNVAFLEMDKLEFPLTLRRWEHGDTFQPLGMEGKHKKVQDFFSDEKLTRFEKERVWILASGGQICWIVGHRLDERFKISRTSRRILKITFHPKRTSKLSSS